MATNTYRREEAERFIRKTDEELSRLPDFVRDYVFVKKADLSASTIYQYVRDIRIFLEYCCKNCSAARKESLVDIELKDLDLIPYEDMVKFRAFFMKNHSKPTVRRMISSVSAMYAFYLKRGILHNNVAAAVMPRLKKEDRKKEINRLRDTESDRILSGAQTGRGLTKKQLKFHKKLGLRDYCILRIFLFTGIRVSELVGLDIADVHLQDCSLSVVRKGGVRERVYFDDETGMVLAEYLEVRKANKFDDGDPALFLSNRNKRSSVRTIETMVKKYASAILPEHEGISPHKLRATFATDFYVESGGDLLLTAKRMGHESVATTMIYAEATKQREKESRNVLLTPKRTSVE